MIGCFVGHFSQPANTKTISHNCQHLLVMLVQISPLEFKHVCLGLNKYLTLESKVIPLKVAYLYLGSDSSDGL